MNTRELCDLYGRRGFDVLAVTDHATRIGAEVTAELYDAYLAEIEAEAARARSLYDLLVLPGLELTLTTPSPPGPRTLSRSGCAATSTLPRGRSNLRSPPRTPGGGARCRPPVLAGRARRCDARDRRLRGPHRRAGATVDRFELFNRHTLFDWVAAAGLPAIATVDFHDLSHLRTWKTLLPCPKDEDAVLAYLQSPRPAFLVSLDEIAPARAA